MGFFKRIKARMSRSKSPSPPAYEPTDPPAYEEHPVYRIMEEKSAAAESLITVQIHNHSFQVPVSALEQKAPKFLEKYRKSETLVSGIEYEYPPTPMTADILAHWLHRNSIHESLLHKDKENTQLTKEIGALQTLFSLALRCEMVELMDSIMDFITSSKLPFQINPSVVVSYYTNNSTPAPCGIKLFVIRALAHSIYTHSRNNSYSPLNASDFELISKYPEIMRDVFQIWASQENAGTKPKDPRQYPACSYHHERFVVTE